MSPVAIILATTGLEPETAGGINFLVPSSYHWGTYYMVTSLYILYMDEPDHLVEI
jgi:hypothetical protein